MNAAMKAHFPFLSGRTLSGPLLAGLLAAVVVYAAPVLPARAQSAAAQDRSAQDKAADDAFLAARDAFRAGQRGRLALAARQLTDHPLHPWIEYWNLLAQLQDVPIEAVREFLDRRHGSYVAERLRLDWLKVLAKNDLWDEFARERPRLVNEDADILCWTLASRVRLGDAGAIDELRGPWFASRELPEGCIPVARAAFESGRYGMPELWSRIRTLSEAGLATAAKRAIAYLPRGDTPDARQLDAAIADPARYAARIASGKLSHPAQELAAIAIARMARNDPAAAATLFEDRLKSRLSPELRGHVYGQLGLQGARRLMPVALQWYREAGAVPLSDEQLAWRARIALREGAWADVGEAIARMSRDSQAEATWVYWQGRVAQAQGRVAEAAAAYRRIAAEHSFYGRLAAEELGIAVALPPRAAPLAEGEIAAAATEPGLARSLMLFRLGLRTEAVREWNWTIRPMDDRQLLAAAEVARRAEVWDRAINTADRTVALHDFGMRYLAPYHEVLAENARARELEPSWVLGLVRQESRFIANARSSAGAAGLMQLMPATARWVAGRMGMKDFQWSRVHEPEVNAALGTFYLRQVLDELDGSPVLAAAAYNAGPGRARRWRDVRPLEGAIYAESIPFNETRDYVKKVMTNTLYYSAVLGAPVQSLKQRLGVIGARGADRRSDTP